MTMISGRGALVRGRVTASGEFLELNSEEFRSLVARDAELNEVFMRAFILRRLLLIESGLGNVILMGSRHSAQEDRKSTRLNSSHANISYAVFCLKKKKKQHIIICFVSDKAINRN